MAAFTSLVPPASAQVTVTSDPVGFTASTLLAESDSYLSIPFTRPPEFSGTVQSISGNTVTVNGSPGWVTNQFVYSGSSQPNYYYALLGQGGSANKKEGHTFAVTGSSANSLTFDISFEDLSGVTANTEITLIPNWTPATIFPASDVNVSFTPTTSSSSLKTQMRVPSASTPGINLPFTTYFFSNNVDGSSSNVGWRKVGDANTDHGDDPLLPDTYFVVRNANGAPGLAFTSLGAVLMKKIAVPLMTATNQSQDNAVAMIRPVSVALDFTGLAPIDNSFVQNDQLLLFDNSQPGFDKAPSAVYTYNNGWRLGSDAVTDHGKDLIPAGSAMLVRKGSSPGNRTVFWTNPATYASGSSILPLQVASRKTHGTNGPSFDINLPIVGFRGIESRRGSSGLNDFQLVATFSTPVTSVSSASIVSKDSAATVDPGVITTVNGHGIVTFNLHNVSNAQVASLSMTGISDGTNSLDLTVPTGFLIGDTTGDGSVNSADISQTKSRSGQDVTAANFRADVTIDGSINSADISLVKSKSGTALP